MRSSCHATPTRSVARLFRLSIFRFIIRSISLNCLAPLPQLKTFARPIGLFVCFCDILGFIPRLRITHSSFLIHPRCPTQRCLAYPLALLMTIRPIHSTVPLPRLRLLPSSALPGPWRSSSPTQSTTASRSNIASQRPNSRYDSPLRPLLSFAQGDFYRLPLAADCEGEADGV